MSEKTTIALVGASGAVGQSVIKLLAPLVAIKAGCRRLPAQCHEQVEYVALDLFDQTALQQFCRGSRLVINCAAPSSKIGDRVARIAAEMGIDYLDPGGDDALHHSMKDNIAQGKRCIVSAGMLPGLSAILPRVLISKLDSLASIQGYALSCEPFSRGGATDFLASLDSDYGMAGLSLQQGRLQPCSTLTDCRLPLASDSAQGVAFITSEWLRLSKTCGCSNTAWFNLFPAGELAQWLTQYRRNSTIGEAVERLMALSLADFAGRQSQHVLAVEVSGSIQGNAVSRALVVKASQGAQLTAAVTAFTARLCLAHRLPQGLHFAADILPPQETLDYLQDQVVGFQQIRLDSLFDCEEGAL